MGYAVFAWFLRYITAHGFTLFVVYRIATGLALLVLLAVGVLAPRG